MSLGPITAIALLVIGVAVLVGIVLLLSRGKNTEKGKTAQSNKSREQLKKEANRALAQNPKDHRALRILADAYFDEKAWEKALRTYGVLVNLCATSSEIDEYTVNLRYGLAAIQLNQFDEAYKALAVSRSKNPEGFELNYNLGFLEFKRKSFEKAITYLRTARELAPDHLPTMKYLAHSLYRVKKFSDALALLRRYIDAQPDDKEAVFVMAQAYYELGQNDQATKIFAHLRADPVFGPRATLMSGSIHLKNHHYEKAQTDLELGLRHENVPADIAMELRYRLAAAYAKTQQIAKALPLLEQIQQARPNYKDVAQQIHRFRELNTNKNLQIYLISPPSEFVSLCRRVTMNFFKGARIKIVDISLGKNEYADVLAEVETSQWIDTILFRYIRTTGQVGELLLRDFHGRLKDLKAGRGFCISAGEFSEGAHQFVEARLIDLIDKNELVKVLNRAA